MPEKRSPWVALFHFGAVSGDAGIVAVGRAVIVTMKYRREIDGLRAVAVVPVILFHAGLSVFSGGYVGVDVFFVISGYLITTIIITERDEGRFSILRFYERRARRILPALFLVMGLCLPFAWFWLPPEPFDDFLRSLAYAALFISNVHFLENTGYFAEAAELRPLLHTWSLAVEEQYYVVFPLLLALLGAFGRRKHIVVIGLLAAASLALSEWGWRNYPEENFFFTLSRMWELFAGSICAFIVFRRKLEPNGALATLGLGLIVYSIFFYDGAVPFPSVYALAPVLGTCLVLLFATQGTMVARLLSMKLPVAIGLISYSAYLWHQPLLAFGRARSMHEPALWLLLALGLASFGLAALSWRFVEQPFRAGPNKLLRGRMALFGVSGVGIAAFAAFGFVGMDQNWAEARYDKRMPPFYKSIITSMKGHNLTRACYVGIKNDEIRATRFCTVYDGEGPGETIAVFGDSHAQAILPAFEAYAEESGARIVKSGLGGCPPLIGAYVAGGNYSLGTCHELSQDQAAYVVQNDVTTVVLVGRWSLYAQGGYDNDGRHFLLNSEPSPQLDGREASFEVLAQTLPSTVDFYRRLGVRVIVVEQLPEMQVHPRRGIYAAVSRGDTPEEATDVFKASALPVAEHDALQAKARSVFAGLQGAEVVDLSGVLRKGDAYHWFIDGRAAYSDLDHVSAYGASLLQAQMAEILSRQ